MVESWLLLWECVGLLLWAELMLVLWVKGVAMGPVGNDGAMLSDDLTLRTRFDTDGAAGS